MAGLCIGRSNVVYIGRVEWRPAANGRSVHDLATLRAATMRCISVLGLASATLAACSAATGPSWPPASVTGVWSTAPPQSGTVLTSPGGPYDLVLTQSGDSVTGF